MPEANDLSAWDFSLSDDRIARYPLAERDASRLMMVPLDGTPLTHHAFHDIVDMLGEGDLLVANDTRVMNSRLLVRRPTGGRVELLVLESDGQRVSAMAKPSRRLRVGGTLLVGDDVVFRIAEDPIAGVVVLEATCDVDALLERYGQVPLPPYLGRPEEAADRERYQTVYAGPKGAAAAPTAGLHFTEDVLARLREKGVAWATVTLHVGLGTFRPLREEDLVASTLHRERYHVPETTVAAIRATRECGGRVIAVGTTTVRTLEAATGTNGLPMPGWGETNLFLRPPTSIQSIDGLITNFHLPKSSLLMLVSCLCGRERLFAAYADAQNNGYRFFSYGDAMLLI